MGFWGNLWKGVKSVAKEIGTGIYDAGRAVGKWVSDATKSAVRKIDNSWQGIVDWAHGGKKKIGASPQLSPTPTTKEVIDISQLLEDLKNQIRTKVIEVEDEAMDVVENSFDCLLRNVQGVDSAILLRLNHDLRQIRKQINGISADYISTHISLDNPECKRILEMPPGAQKEGEWEKFSSNSVKEIKRLMCNNIDDFLTQEWKSIKGLVSGQFDTDRKQIETLRGDIDALIQDTTKDTNAKEEHIANACYKIAVCDYVNEVLETV